MATRINGQLWLDKNNTHRLKYHIDNKTYEVLTSQTFTDANPSSSLRKGLLLAMSTGSSPAPAIWPKDADRIEGVVTSIETENNQRIVSVASTGRVIFTATELADCFVGRSALPSTTWRAIDKPGIGCPVYWFIGKSVSFSSYIDSSDSGYAGKLTFETPSGFKYKTAPTGEEFNISYDDLPIVGHVADYEYSDSNFTSLTIDLHFSGFEPSITWNYPGTHTDGHLCGKLENGTHKFYHGLFADNAENSICISELTIRAIDWNPGYPADAEEYTIVAPYRNYIKAENDRHTDVTFNSAETLRYRITGTVHYNIDRRQN